MRSPVQMISLESSGDGGGKPQYLDSQRTVKAAVLVSSASE
jgi:hypothetical protein